MDTFEAIHNRRSIRQYKSIPVDKDQLFYLVHLALRAPNAGNLQDFQFIVCTDRETIMSLPQHCMDQMWISSAPAVIVVCSRPEIQKKWYGEAGDFFARQNAAAAAQNICLGATAMGLGTCWITGFNQEKVEEHFKADGSARVEAILTIGYAAEKPDPRREPRIESHMFFDSYGNDIKNFHKFNQDYSVFIEKKFKKVKEKQKDTSVVLKEKAKHITSQLKKKFIDIKDNSKQTTSHQDTSNQNTSKQDDSKQTNV